MKQIKSSIAKAGLATALIILLPSISIASDYHNDRDDDYKNVHMSDRDNMNERHHDRAKKKRSHRHGNHDNNRFGHDIDRNDDHRK